MEWQKDTPPATHADATPTVGPRLQEVMPTRPRALVVMHWLTVLFLVVAATLILWRDQVDGRSVREWLLEGHRHFGLFILLLFVARVAYCFRVGRLPSEGDTSAMLRLAAGSTHVALYVLLLIQPLLGWALSSAEGKPVHFLGLTLPALVASDEDLADTLTVWHQDVAWVLLAFITLHAGAALWHHFVLRDRTLRMMLPKRRP